MSNIHDVRECFSLAKFLAARESTIKAVETIRSRVFIGMTEESGLKIIDKTLKDMGIEKKWHPSKFRIGKNTIKSFKDKSDPEITLSDSDIFFIDIGPVWDNHEGDYGKTFVLGESEDYLQIANASKSVFDQTATAWRNDKLSGIELYRFAENCASDLGYDLNRKMSGHRVGDFPHHLFYRGGLEDSEEIPCDNLWVLEIHLISRNNQYGSFFEDILQR